jgi:class 3 adenylate cyclase
MKKHFLLLLTAMLTAATLPANAKKQGQEAIDSMLQELPKFKDDTNKANLLYYVGATYRSIDLAACTKYGNQMLDLSNRIGWKSGVAKASALLGVAARRAGDFQKALDHLTVAADIYTELADKANLAKIYMNMGNVAGDQEDRPKALNYYFKCLKTHEELGDKLSQGEVCTNIALLYNDDDNRAKALEYYFRALKLFDETGRQDESAVTLGDIGLTYSQEGNDSLAINYYEQAIKIDERTGDNAQLAVVKGNMGHSYVMLKNYKRGIAELESALKMEETLGEQSFIAQDLQYLGESYVTLAKDSLGASRGLAGNKQQWLEKAKSYLIRGVDISRAIEFPDGMQNCYLYLAEAYRLQGDFKHAILYNDSFYAIHDTAFSNNSRVKMANLATKREEDLKEKQIAINKLAIEKKRNERIFFGVGAALLLVIISGLFVSRRAVQKEKNISESLLLNILPGEVADELKKKGSADAKLIDEATVLFTDFKGFTQLSEKLSPQALVTEINACFSAFDNIVHKYNVEKIKTIGDAYMAAGGLPTPNSTHATDVVKAAIAMQLYMQQYKAERQAEGKLYFEMRIGIHTGPLVAGIVGVKKFQYDIWGDTVNTASRMESSGEPGEINISQTTYELVKDQFNCVYRGEIAAKSKGMMNMYFVKQV